MADWRTGEAKQRFSEVLRRCQKEPQRIFRRTHLVAAIVSADEYEDFAAWRLKRQGRSLDAAFGEVREISARYEYELDTGTRRDRDAWED